MPKFHLSFSQPRHGWLPVGLDLNGRVLAFRAFHGPNNPVRELYKAVEAALNGRLGAVWWHLEPDGYFFELSQLAGTFHLRVLYAEQSLFSPKREVALLRGPAGEVVEPLLQALCDFSQLGIELPHWRNTELPAIDALARAVRPAGRTDEARAAQAEADARAGQQRQTAPVTGW